MTRGRKIVAWAGAVLVLTVIMVVAFVVWVLFTTAGARWVADTATQRFAPQVRYASIDGTIAGKLEISDFRFEGDAYTAKMRIAHMSVDPTLSMLFSRVLRIERATVRGLVLTLPEQEKPDEPEKPLWVEPPLEVVVRDFALEDGRVMDGREQLVSVKQLGVAAHWSREALTIERLVAVARRHRGQSFRDWTRDAAGPDAARAAGREMERRRHSGKARRPCARDPGRAALQGHARAVPGRGQFRCRAARRSDACGGTAHGTPQHATLHNLTLRQRAGRLALQGLVDFKPDIGWNLHASADDFNPGALLAGWDGKVDLEFLTRGQLAEAGPRGNLELKTLSGNLRGRPLAGQGKIDFAAPSLLAGDLR